MTFVLRLLRKLRLDEVDNLVDPVMHQRYLSVEPVLHLVHKVDDVNLRGLLLGKPVALHVERRVVVEPHLLFLQLAVNQLLALQVGQAVTCQMSSADLFQGDLLTLLLLLESEGYLVVAGIRNHASAAVAAYKLTNALLLFIIIIIKHIWILA